MNANGHAQFGVHFSKRACCRMPVYNLSTCAFACLHVHVCVPVYMCVLVILLVRVCRSLAMRCLGVYPLLPLGKSSLLSAVQCATRLMDDAAAGVKEEAARVGGHGFACEFRFAALASRHVTPLKVALLMPRQRGSWNPAFWCAIREFG